MAEKSAPAPVVVTVAGVRLANPDIAVTPPTIISAVVGAKVTVVGTKVSGTVAGTDSTILNPA